MKKILPVVISLLLTVAMITSSIVFAVASAEGTMFNGKATLSDKDEDIYDNISINKITGVGDDPDEISGEASALGVEKEWYEYITYSPNPVASYRIDDDQRLIFYDPYEYTGAMIMKIQNLETEWGTYSSISKTITQSNTIGATYTDGTTINSSIQHQDGLDQTMSSTVGSTDSSGQTISAGSSATTSWSTSVDSTTSTGGSRTVDESSSVSGSVALTEGTKISAREEVGTYASAGGEAGFKPPTGAYASTNFEAGTSLNISSEQSVELSATETIGTSTTVGISSTDSSSSSISQSASESGSTSENISEAISQSVTGSESKTAGWSIVADRITTALGSSSSTCRSWSNTQSTSLTINYAATHFTEGGTPFSWNVAHYIVYMPMLCEKQYKVGGEWVTTSSCYVILTTLEGTCRTWIQNSKVYYEDWGTGEAVTWEDFFRSFYTEDNLIKAYQNKLYPDS